MDSIEKRARNYNVNNDSNGAIGIGLANELFLKYGSIENIPDLSLEGNVTKAKEILSKYHIKEIQDSRQKTRGVLGRLKREAGVQLKDYNRMDAAPMANYCIDLMRKYKAIS